MFLCQLRPKAFILHYACVKIHNIPNCYWQDPFKYDILRVTHKAGSFNGRILARTGRVFASLIVLRLVSCERARTEEKHGKTECCWRHAGTTHFFVDSSVNGCRFLIGDYDFFRPYGLWFHPAGHHERDDPSPPDYHRQPDSRPQGRHDRRLHVRYLFLYPVLAGTERVAVVCCTV